METSEEDEGNSVPKLGLCLGLLIEYLRIVVERERKAEKEEALFEEQVHLHEDQYHGTEMEVWFYRDDFRFDWM